MSTAKNVALCISVLLAFQGGGDRIDHTGSAPSDCRAYITATFLHCRFTITTCQRRVRVRDTRSVASEKLDVSTATTATDLGASEQEDGLIMHGRQHVYRVQGDGESLDREKLDGGTNGAARRGEGRGEGLLQASL